MPQPGKGSAGKPNVAAPIENHSHPSPKNNGVVPPPAKPAGTSGK